MIDSDHTTQYIDVNLKIRTEKSERERKNNFKDKNYKDTFKRITSESFKFTNCFRTVLPLLTRIENWRNVLRNYCNNSFKKIRICKKKFVKPLNGNISALIDERNRLLKNTNVENEEKISSISLAISELEAKDNINLIIENFQTLSDNPETVNLQQDCKQTLTKTWKCPATCQT